MPLRTDARTDGGDIIGPAVFNLGPIKVLCYRDNFYAHFGNILEKSFERFFSQSQTKKII